MDFAAVKGLAVLVDMLVCGRGEPVYLGYLKLFGYFCTQVQRVGVVVGIRVVDETQIEPALLLEMVRSHTSRLTPTARRAYSPS
jgi:hypothetical protein